jgi:hypothetical protein
MSRALRLLHIPAFLGLFAVLFDITSVLGGLGPGELTAALFVTLPVPIRLRGTLRRLQQRPRRVPRPAPFARPSAQAVAPAPRAS